MRISYDKPPSKWASSKMVSAPLCLKAVFVSRTSIIVAGFSAIELRCAGYSATELRIGGFTLEEILEAGFSHSR
jgi:ribosomal protein L13E